MIRTINTIDIEVFKVIENILNFYLYNKEYLVSDYSFIRKDAVVYIIHIKDTNNKNIISLYYDEQGVASYIIDYPYYQLYNLITDTNKRYYENETDILIADIKTIIKKHYSNNKNNNII